MLTEIDYIYNYLFEFHKKETQSSNFRHVLCNFKLTLMKQIIFVYILVLIGVSEMELQICQEGKTKRNSWIG